nr:Fic family protein [uncultured Sellimonas sp.]
MYEKKYNMTKEENIFWAKRNLVDYIWKSANLEGIAITFPETQTIFEGISVQGKSIDDINSIVQMKHGWQYVLSTLDDELSLTYIKKLHLELGKMTIINAGSFRMDEVRIAGSSYIPPMPVEFEVKQHLDAIVNSSVDWTEKALDLMLYLVKAQLFYDGNKRIAMMVANKVLISHGCGILSVSQDDLEQFFTLLVAYYEDENRKEKLKLFLYDKCLDGFKKSIA